MKNKKLLLVLTVLTIILGIFLRQEIKNSLSITTRAEEPPIATNGTPLPIFPTDQKLGNPGSALEIVEFVDLSNARSKQLHTELSSFVKAHPQTAHLVFKHAPVPHFLFGGSELAHKAAFCAGKQNKLWDFVETLIYNSASLKESGLRKVATAINLNTNSWWTCVNSPAANDAVLKDLSEAEQLGLGQPPLIFLNNKKMSTSPDINVTELLTMLIK